MPYNRPRNRKMVRLLALRTLKANRLRFIITGIAVALTALMITGVFTMGLSLYETDKLQRMYRFGGTFHGVIFNISMDEKERLAASGMFTEYGYLTSVTRFPGGLPVEIVVGSENLPELSMTDITGHMPRQYDETAMSTASLDRYGAEHELGETVYITYQVNETEIIEAFTLCGYWREDPVGALMKSRIFLSEAFYNTLPVDTSLKGGVTQTMLFVNMDKPKNIEDQLETVVAKLSINAICDANPVYESGETNVYDFLPNFALLLLAIMVSANLLINNIFYISVARDIRFYGLIKAIGTTKRQIRRIIRTQALYVSLVAIPIGLLLGYAVSLVAVPSFLIAADLSMYIVSSNPLIFIFAVIFTLATVLFSANRPGSFAGRTSPMEAIQHMDTRAVSAKRERKTVYGAKLPIMAARNLLRGKKKLALTTLSLSTGLLLFFLVCSLIASFNIDKYLSNLMYGDLRINDFNLNTLSDSLSVSGYGDRLTADIAEALEQQDGVEYTEAVYYYETKDMAIQSPFPRITFINGVLAEEIYDNETVEVYGLSGGWVDKLAEFIGGGEFDKDLFLSGDYAIISKTHRFNNVAADGDIDSFGGNIAYHQPGDKINLVGIDRELTVLAVTKGTAFTCIGEKKQIANRYELYLPAHIVKGLDNTHLMSVAVFTNDLPVAEDGIKALIHGMGGLTLMSVSTYMQVFNSQIGSLTTIALGLAILLCIVGMVNFINTSATAIIARQYELSALESIGMTKTQVEGMIITECLYMGGIALTLAALLSYPFSKTMIGTMVRENGFVEFTYAWQPILGWLIFICCAGVVTSLATYQNIARGSISERLAV